jgi:general stress protein 26
MWEPAAEAYVQAKVEIIDDRDEKRRLWNSGLFPFPLAGFFGSPDNDDFVFLQLTRRGRR